MSQWYGVFNSDGFPAGGFWLDTLHGVDNIPDEAVAITDAQHREFTRKQGRRALVNGVVVTKTPTVTEPTVEELITARTDRDEIIDGIIEFLGSLPNQTVAGVRTAIADNIRAARLR